MRHACGGSLIRPGSCNVPSSFHFINCHTVHLAKAMVASPGRVVIDEVGVTEENWETRKQFVILWQALQGYNDMCN